MKPQYIGAEGSDRQEVASLASLLPRSPAVPFLSSKFSARFAHGYSQDTSLSSEGQNVGQAESSGSVETEKKSRRHICPKPSKLWSHSASLLSLRPALSKPKKNTLPQIQRRSRLSRHTPANTSNSLRRAAPVARASEIHGLSGQEGLVC